MDTDAHNNDYNCWRENRKRLSVCTRNFSFMTNTTRQEPEGGDLSENRAHSAPFSVSRYGPLILK